MFGRFFHKKQSGQLGQHGDERPDEWYHEKSDFMETVLGEQYKNVLRAPSPYRIGAKLSLYLYPNHKAGTAVATKDLVECPSHGPGNSTYDAYELVMVTRHSLRENESHNSASPFGGALQQINRALNAIARYSAETELNAGDLCEYPNDESFGDLRGCCFIFDAYSPPDESKQIGVGLLLVMEIHCSEFKYAQEYGSQKLLEKLKKAGHYPCSDLEREAV